MIFVILGAVAWILGSLFVAGLCATTGRPRPHAGD